LDLLGGGRTGPAADFSLPFVFPPPPFFSFVDPPHHLPYAEWRRGRSPTNRSEIPLTIAARGTWRAAGPAGRGVRRKGGAWAFQLGSGGPGRFRAQGLRRGVPLFLIGPLRMAPVRSLPPPRQPAKCPDSLSQPSGLGWIRLPTALLGAPADPCAFLQGHPNPGVTFPPPSGGFGAAAAGKRWSGTPAPFYHAASRRPAGVKPPPPNAIPARRRFSGRPSACRVGLVPPNARCPPPGSGGSPGWRISSPTTATRSDPGANGRRSTAARRC